MNSNGFEEIKKEANNILTTPVDVERKTSSKLHPINTGIPPHPLDNNNQL